MITVCDPFIVPVAFTIVGPTLNVYPAAGAHVVVNKGVPVSGLVPVNTAPVKLPPKTKPDDGPP